MGKLIVIEGVDSVGKHTQTLLLVEKLKKEGHAAQLIDFPQYDSFTGKIIKKYLTGGYGSKEQLGAEIPSLFFAFNFFEFKDKLMGIKERKEIGILDRYEDSNKAYQGAKLPPGERGVIWAFQEEVYNLLHLPKADKVVYLRAPYEVIQELSAKREKETGRKKDIHERDDNYQRNVIEVYDTLAKKEGWIIIECTKEGKLLPREAIAERVWNAVKPLLPKP